MYIEPSTSVRFLRNVPLDNRYKHTLYFASQSAQNSYFVGQTKYNVTNYTYQRKERGYLKVGIKADNLYDCNYMMYQNSNFGTKWFYAFITSVEYVSNDTSLVQFEIDEIQTWLFEMQLKECYVERQHTVSDELFEHYEPEPVDFGNMVTLASYLPDVSGVSGDFNTWNLVVCSAPDGQSSVHPFVQNGVVSCAEYYWCANNSSSVNDFLTNVMSDYNQDAIYSVYLFPSVFVGNSTGEGHLIDRGQSEPVMVTLNAKLPESINGYTPKNKKLFSSPYTMYEATDDCGNSQFYYPELFKSGNVYFNVYGKYVGNPEITMTPLSYKDETENFSESFSIQNFPMASFASDTFRAWLANNGTQVGLNAMNNIVGSVANMASGNVVGLAYNSIGLTSSINQVAVAYNQPNKLVTTDNSGTIAVLKQKVPRLKIKCLTPSYLKQVDDFFTVYGYHVSVVGVPNVHARKEFTYVKTNDCVVRGNIPQDSMKTIAGCFDKGMTWWVNPSNVGNYSVDNGVLG